MKIPFLNRRAQTAAKYTRVGFASIGMTFIIVAAAAASNMPTIAIIDTTPLSSRPVGDNRLNTPATDLDARPGDRRAVPDEKRTGRRGADADDDWMAASIPDSIVGATAPGDASAIVFFDTEDNRSVSASHGMGHGGIAPARGRPTDSIQKGGVVKRTQVALVPDAGGTLMLLGAAMIALFSQRRRFYFS